MVPPISIMTYSFDKSASENMIANLRNSMMFTVNYTEVFGKNGDWDSLMGVVDGIVEGVDVKQFIVDIYDGSVPQCLIQKLVREVRRLVEDLFDAIGLGKLGCALSGVIGAIFGPIADIFASFVCTATTEAGMGNDMILSILKQYTKNNLIGVKDGVLLYRIYEDIGPKIVKEIDSRPDREDIYNYVYNRYIFPLYIKVTTEQETPDKLRQLTIDYLMMIDEVIQYLGMPEATRLNKWKVKNGM